MRRRGIQFASALPAAPQAADDIQKYVQAGGVICNPWPSLADPVSLDFGQTNPWIRLIYLPTVAPLLQVPTELGPHEKIRLMVGQLHEHIHVALDFTPSKEWVRVWFAQTYAIIGSLYDAADSKWDRNTDLLWNKFLVFQGFMEETVQRICLAEELLATAFSFCAVEKRLRTAQARALLSYEEKQWVRAQTEQEDMQDFESLYYDLPDHYGEGGFKTVAALMLEDEATPSALDLGQLGVYLEGITLTGTFPLSPGKTFWPVARDSLDRCTELATTARHIRNKGDLLHWVRDRIITEDLESWQMVLGIMAGITSQSKTQYPAQALWSLARGHDLPPRRKGWRWKRSDLPWELKRAQEVSSQPWLWPETSFRWTEVEWIQVLLYPHQVAGRWYIMPRNIGGNFRENYEQLLITEAFRQQLQRGVGIQCPRAVLEGPEGVRVCHCDVGWRRRLRKLAAWAHDGKFGNDEWTAWNDLPTECRPAT